MSTVTVEDGKTYQTNFYNINAIITVGVPRQQQKGDAIPYLGHQDAEGIYYKSFFLDDDGMKQGNRFGKDYFDELLKRIREIRASERQKIRIF